MARGNEIIVTADPKGTFMEGIIVGALKPGTIVQRDPTVALVSGRHSYKVFTRGADGKRPAGALYILLSDQLQGRLVSTAYVSGERCFLYTPEAGEEYNLLLGDVAGTADDHTKGELLMVDDTTGKLVAATGSPESTPFQLLETITDPVADTLVWVLFSGF